MIWTSDDGERIYISQHGADRLKDFIYRHDSIFPGMKFLHANLNVNGFLREIPRNLTYMGHEWNVINVSKIKEGDGAIRTYIAYVTEDDMKMLKPVDRRRDGVSDLLSSITMNLRVHPDVDLDEESVKCGPGRTTREILYQLIFKHHLECYVTGGTVYIFNPGDFNEMNIGAAENAAINLGGNVIDPSYYFVKDNIKVTTAGFKGIGFITPGHVFSSRSPHWNDMKVVYCSRYGPDDCESSILVMLVHKDRFMDAEAMAYMGLLDSPGTHEIRTWRAKVQSTRSFVARTQGTPPEVRFPVYDWYTGEEPTKKERAKTTDFLLPYHARNESGTFACKFPCPSRAWNSSPSFDFLVMLPEHQTGDVHEPFVGRSVQLGVPVPNEKIENEDGDKEPENNLYFRIPGSVRSGNNVGDDGILRWSGNSRSGSNYWELMYRKKSGESWETTRIKIGDSNIEITTPGESSIVLDGDDVTISAQRTAIGQASNLQPVTRNGDNVNGTATFMAWINGVATAAGVPTFAGNHIASTVSTSSVEASD